MKNFLHICSLALGIFFLNNASAQTVYNINANTNFSASHIPEQCSNCVINIATGVTLTINKDIYLSNVTFNGGNLYLNNKSITFWAPGSFNNVNVSIEGNKGGITSSGALDITNAEFVFEDNSKATFWAPVVMTSSKMKFLNNAGMESTSTFNLISNSSLSAGDGTTASKAYVMFNGGTLNEYDNSYVTIAERNNYYFNWHPFNTLSNGHSYNTTFNTINCGTAGKNACDGPMVYGPVTLNFAGVASSAILPVRLSAFSVSQEGNTVKIGWTTDMEMNADRYEIERSVDGINWTPAGSVKAKGNSFVVTRYSYTDVQKVNGSLSYRLKMIDKDETFIYSPIKTVKAEGDHTVKIYPNPASEYVTVSLQNISGKADVQLISQSGQVVKQVKGSSNIVIPVSGLHAGQYFVRVITGTGVAEVFKLLISK